MKMMKKYLNFKEACYKTGNTDEAIAKTEKLGFKTDFPEVLHPFIKDKTLPVFFSNFVLMEYGTGNFGCPAHDQRDLDFG